MRDRLTFYQNELDTVKKKLSYKNDKWIGLEAGIREMLWVLGEIPEVIEEEEEVEEK